MTIHMVPDSTRFVTGGVDTHKHVHVGAVIDFLGRKIETAPFPTTTEGYQDLLDWMRSFGEVSLVGVEGTGSWGIGLTRHLTGEGVKVVEISRPNRRERRLKGKSDTIDAVSAARAAAAGTHHGAPKSGSGPVEAIRVIMNARESAVKARTATSNQIHAIIDTANTDVRDRFRALTMTRLTASVLEISESDDAAIIALQTLGTRWQFLNTQARDLKKQLDNMVAKTAPNLSEAYCIGSITAAKLLVAAGDNPHRLHSEGAFAALCGASPVPASSGQTGRYRLNRGGNRQANSALYTITISRMRNEERTKAYVTRRTTEGKPKRDIMRCLKRAIARETYQLIIKDLGTLA